MVLRALLAASTLLPLALALPAAAKPKPQSAMVPFNPNSAQVQEQLAVIQTDTVEQFDPVARAQLLTAELPRRWSGSYQAYGPTGASQAVQLDLSSLTAVGQMVVVRGTMTIGAVSTPVQGNINAKSDQLDLLLLGDTSAAGLEAGGEFQGLQTFELSAWEAPRLTTTGGKLTLNPVTGG